MVALEQVNTNAMLARTEDASLSMESLLELLNSGQLDSMQWFYLTAFLNDMQHHMEELRKIAEQSRPSKEVRSLLVESYLGISS